MNKLTTLMAAVALVALWLHFISFAAVANHNKIILNFDDLFTGEQLTDQFIDQGVVFSGTFEGNLTAGLVETEPAFGTFFFGNSEPNFVIVGVGRLTATFTSPVSNVSFRAGDADSAEEAFGVTAFDPEGAVVFSSVVHLFEEGATININERGIAEIRIFQFLGGGFAIDDFSYMR